MLQLGEQFVVQRESAARQLDGAIEQANALLNEMNERCFDLLARNESILRDVALALTRTETVPGAYVYDLIRENGVRQSPELEAVCFSAAASGRAADDLMLLAAPDNAIRTCT